MRQLLVWGSLVGVLGLAAPAGAGERSWYMGLEGGVEFDGDGSSNETGWAGLITLGGGITSHINLEAELGYRSTSVDTIFELVDIKQTSLMFNALYEAPLSKEVSFVVGFGVGGENVSYDGFVFGADENEIEIAAQVKVGLNIALSDSTDLVANYRYMTTVGDLDITNSTLTVGISFDL